ncbi:MAG: thymidylate synthase [Candidatus Dojkabacteria bacterium]|nr:thymidylate synthase [Candidatus Dojkabacteria bacterium]MDQ7020374.1 thymidylate synthase [Candidatus Dojkabacteria bacterium]
MITINEDNSISKVWRKTLATLLDSNQNADNKKYFRDSPALITLENSSHIEYDNLFPMGKKDLEIINNYIYSGENEELVVHEWTKIYHHRIFDQPNSQIEFMIKKLKEKLPTGESQISIWDKNIDQDSKISPCTQILWARIKDDTLEWHTHAHSSDAYKKIFMNISEFVSLQYYVAKKVGVKPGKYIHFIDSLHIHWKDLERVKDTVKAFKSV